MSEIWPMIFGHYFRFILPSRLWSAPRSCGASQNPGKNTYMYTGQMTCDFLTYAVTFLDFLANFRKNTVDEKIRYRRRGAFVSIFDDFWGL